MKRANIRAIFPEATDEQIDQVLTAVHGEVDSLRDQIDELQEKLNKSTQDGSKDANEWKSKYESEHNAFESYKSAQVEKESRAKKQSALSDLLKGTLSDKGIKMATKYSDYSSIEMGEDGTIKNASTILSSLKDEWAEFVTETKDGGVETSGAGGASGGSTGKAMTKEEIMNIKDTTKRREAMAEHLDLFQ